MKKYKRFLSVLLCAVVLFAVFAIPASAREEQPLRNEKMLRTAAAKGEVFADKKTAAPNMSDFVRAFENNVSGDAVAKPGELDALAAQYKTRLEAEQGADKEIMASKTLESSTYALSYYSGTSVPTYTSVTGRSLLKSFVDDGYAYYYYTYNQDDMSYYMAYLEVYCGWTYLGVESAADSSYGMFFFKKNGFLLSVIADFSTWNTVIMFEQPATAPTSISLNTSSRTMIVGNTYSLEATVSPSNVTPSISWSSSNSAVASVNSDGVVTAKAAGSATITARTSNGKTASCYITVKSFVLDYYPGTKLPTFTCVTGKSVYNSAVNNGVYMYFYRLDVDSYLDYVRYLDEKDGWELLTVDTDEDTYYSEFYSKGDLFVLVRADFESDLIGIAYEKASVATTGISLNKTSAEMTVGDKLTLTATVTPSNASNKNVSWTSSNTSVATVSNGTVTAVREGTATITAKTADGGKTASCVVTVYKKVLTVEVGSKTCSAGKTVTVPITIKNNTGIAGLQMKLNYANGLTLQSVAVGSALKGLTFTTPGNLATKPLVLPWDGLDADATNGDILLLTFKVADNAADGTYAISLLCEDVYDNNQQSVEIRTVNGSITVADYIPGDINGDGVITTKDVTSLRRKIAGGYNNNEVVEAALDVNGDGAVTTKDVTTLRRFIAGGYNVELH